MNSVTATKLFPLTNGIFQTQALFVMKVYNRIPYETELKEFIRERDRTVHGGWDASRPGGMESYHGSQYGINLIERLVLRFLAYKGDYYNRITGEVEHFAHRKPDW